MSVAEFTLADRYGTALRSYLHQPDEPALLSAWQLGRDALDAGLDLLALNTLHREVVTSLVRESVGDGIGAADIERAGEFFTEVLAPYEMMVRGYREANAGLKHLSERLEEQVDERTRELDESVSMLRAVDRERRTLLEHLVTAQEKERRRIAEDVHDDSIQIMTAVGIRLATLTKKLDPEDAASLTKLGQVVEAAIGRLRHLLFELHPETLERSGLAAALREQLQQMSENHGIRFTVQDGLMGEPPQDARTVLYRIAQEAFSNVRHHSRARAVTVELEGRDHGTWLRIADDGVGFTQDDIKQTGRGHLGLISMRERAEVAGGSCSVVSGPDQGTTVEVWIPARRT